MLTISYLLETTFFYKEELNMDALTILDEIKKMGHGYSRDRIVKILYVADNGENTCQ